MSVVPDAGNGKITVPDIQNRKSLPTSSPSQTQKITCLTAYDYPTARLLDEAGVDIVLVGDSVGMVVLGYDSTLPVTIEEMLHHTRAVCRGARRALVVADMPYGSYHMDTSESLHNAVRTARARPTPPIATGAGPDCDGRVLVLRYSGTPLRPDPEIRPPIRESRRNHHQRGARILRGCARRGIPIRFGVLSHASRVQRVEACSLAALAAWTELNSRGGARDA